jgi:acetyl esterase/lipase
VADTALSPIAVDVVESEVFSNAGGKPRLADLYIPAGVQGPFPVVLWVHGGGWRFGDRKLAPDLSRFFAQRGFAMVSIDYRLSEEVTFPAPIIDVKAAVRWVRSVAERFSLDPDRIALWGSSAGGHLAACAALSRPEEFNSPEHERFSSSVCAVVDGYGPTDFSRMDADRLPSQHPPSDIETRIVKPSVPTGHADSYESRFIGAPVATSPDQVQRANPINYVNLGAPPFLILHGQSDTLVPWQQSRMLFDALDAAGNEATLVLLEKLNHGFFNNSELDSVDVGAATVVQSAKAGGGDPVTIPEGLRCFALVESFLRRHLSAQASAPRDNYLR